MNSTAASKAELFPSKAHNLPLQSSSLTRKTFSIIELNSQTLKSEVKNRETATDENSKICYLIKKKRSLFKGRFKLWKHETPDGEIIFMIKSQDCPQELFTYIVLDFKGDMKELIDCHNTSTEELVFRTGFQGDIKETKLVQNQLNLAISGDGLFLEKCQDKFYLIRRGNFFISSDKILMTSKGCTIVDQNGKNFIISNKLDNKGCSSSQCLALIQPQPGEFKFLNRNRLRFLGNIEDSLVDSPYIFTNYLEEIDKDAGIIGPNFNQIPEFDKNSCGLNYF
ncbi:MAG: hypothetical protein Q7U04_15315 [Bacteriovorax sp.]|nr:hypothetical protein [Bacteriovorax sp.]